MQIQSTGQTQVPLQTQQTQLRKMDGSGNGQGSRDGSNCTTSATTGSSQQQLSGLTANSTFSIFALN